MTNLTTRHATLHETKRGISCGARHGIACIVFGFMLASVPQVCAQEPVGSPATPAADNQPEPQPAEGQLAPGVPNSGIPQSDPAKPNTDSSASDSTPLTEEEIRETRIHISDLASSVFAERERAAEELLQTGMKVVPAMRRELNLTSDPEVAMRLKSLIHQLHDGQFEAKVRAFLEGDEIDFDGWSEFETKVGDFPKTRDLFISLLREYPETVSALDGTPREKAVALDSARANLILKMRSTMPTTTDAFALLFPASDQNVPISETYEGTMLMVLRINPIPSLPRDPVLGGPFNKLVSSWVQRSTVGNRFSVLTFAMQRGIYTGYPLALDTLKTSNDEELLAVSMQTLSRFGSKDDTGLLLKMIADERTLNGYTFHNGNRVQVHLGDAAMAAIAVLHNIPLSKIGLPDNALDKMYGFHYSDLVFSLETKGEINANASDDMSPDKDAVPAKVKQQRLSPEQHAAAIRQRRERARKELLDLLPPEYKATAQYKAKVGPVAPAN